MGQFLSVQNEKWARRNLTDHTSAPSGAGAVMPLGKKEFLPPHLFFKKDPSPLPPQQKKGARARCPGPAIEKTID